MAITGDVPIEEIFPELATQISQINLWIKGLGALALAGIIYSVVMLIIERKKMKTIEKMSHDLKRLEKKIDSIKRK